MRKKNLSLLIIFLSILDLILIGVLIFESNLLLQGKQGFSTVSKSIPLLTNTPSSTYTNNPTNNSIELSNWKTYTNSDYKFQYKYPVEWEGHIYSRWRCLENISSCEDGSGNTFSIYPPEVTNKVNNLDGEVKINAYLDAHYICDMERKAAPNYFKRLTNHSKGTLNNLQIESFEGITLQLYDNQYHYRKLIVATNPSTCFVIDYIDQENRQYQEIINKILSTFESLE